MRSCRYRLYCSCYRSADRSVKISRYFEISVFHHPNVSSCLHAVAGRISDRVLLGGAVLGLFGQIIGRADLVLEPCYRLGCEIVGKRETNRVFCRSARVAWIAWVAWVAWVCWRARVIPPASRRAYRSRIGGQRNEVGR